MDAPGRMDAMRSWLVSGIHLFDVDPRRRQGHHGRAKDLLVVDSRHHHDASDHWHRLAAALHRHTLRGGLAQLSAEDRSLVALAYLEGRTNQQIALAMGVSVSTVRRRLGSALETLDTYISRSGAWLSAVILFAAAYATAQAGRIGRSAVALVATADRTQKAAAMLAVGTLATAALGLVGVTSHSAPPRQLAPAAMAPFNFPAIESTLALRSGSPAIQTVVRGLHRPDSPIAGAAVRLALTATATLSHTAVTVSVPNLSSPGCHGNPTSAAPSVPVGSKDGDRTGAPVTHPSAGGCRA